MRPWKQRPREIRNLFNPSFCGLLLSRALEGYESEQASGMPFSIALLILPLSLHKETREAFAQGKRSYLVKILETNPQVFVGLAERSHGLLPYTFEALGYLMNSGSITVAENGSLRLVPKRVKKAISGTAESKECQSVAKSVGKKLGVINDRVTVYTSLRIRP